MIFLEMVGAKSKETDNDENILYQNKWIRKRINH